MMQKIYVWTSPLPLLMFWLVGIYVDQYEGWGQWAAAPMLLMPILFSLLMGVLGVVLIVQARKQQEPVANLWLCTAMGASLFLFFAAKAVAMELFSSFG